MAKHEHSHDKRRFLMTPISVCIIGKNEEKNLTPFLSSIRAHFPVETTEIVYVDTGSSDQSVEIARRFTDKVYHFSWINDFSAARNYSLSVASHDYVLILDCDEYVEHFDPTGLQKMIDTYPQEVGMLTRHNCFLQNEVENKYTDDVERFFDRRIHRYKGIIHEQVRRMDGSEYKRIAIPLSVRHVGYNGSAEEIAKKANRNIELLRKMLSDNPEDPYIYFQLGQSYHILKDEENACLCYGKGLSFDVNPEAEYVQLMVVGYGYSLLNLGRQEEALSFEGIYDTFSGSADFVCLMGLIYLRCGLVKEAIAEFKKAAAFQTSKAEGACSFVPNYNLGCIYEVLGDTALAASYYEKCGDFPAAKARLNSLH